MIRTHFDLLCNERMTVTKVHHNVVSHQFWFQIVCFQKVDDSVECLSRKKEKEKVISEYGSINKIK